ncbi:histidine ammonia-lyase [Oceanotoga sp. DSM 15011]|uniref:histidine ammonia-lyase n=1 Tax=Oceanotoga sp. DSM 15011 TaxID=2984951 RepID=UPI0021F4E7A3|nr:histidine ammonia-lyase [Oceanotoga sp. DSM 15011]UYP01162.1 histidine ammonia-lyase [Oceanotoga sp. DSM 15011]
MDTVIIEGGKLNIEDFIKVTRMNAKVELSNTAINKMQKARSYVEKIVEKGDPVYGINTGFGKFCNVKISNDELNLLQKNLIMSHSCGVGNPLSKEIVRGIILLRVNALAIGNSGIRVETVQKLIELLNKNITPFVPEKGSLGASGDLAPLSHVALVIMGMGEAYYDNKLMKSEEALKLANIQPIELREKEGLALINGTQVMTSIGTHAIYDAIKLLKLSDISASMTIEALNGITDAFDNDVHKIRNQKGQIQTAKNILNILKNSKNTTRQAEIRVQDAYTLRCIPQIHGASKDSINYVKEIVEREINAVTDNPLIFPDEEKVISGGNFHGQPIALAMDFLAIACSEIANVSERRIERLVNPQLSDMPGFLSPKGGLNSGFMIAQYSAASLVSENKVLSHPASVDSIPSSANQEDHVSMGTIAARKAVEIIENTYKVIAIETLCSAQAIDIKNSYKKLGIGTKKAYEKIRSEISFMEKDRILYIDINKTEEIIKNDDYLNSIEKDIDIKI